LNKFWKKWGFPNSFRVFKGVARVKCANAVLAESRLDFTAEAVHVGGAEMVK